MRTKKILLTAALFAILSSIPTFAQNAKDSIRKKKFDTKELMEKHCRHMENRLSLDDATAAKFIPMYKEYLGELRANRQKMSADCKKEVKTDAERYNKLENNLKNRQKMLDIQEKYYKKFKKVLNARQLETVFCQHPAVKYGKGGKSYKDCHFHKGHKKYARYAKYYGKKHHHNCDNVKYPYYKK